MTNTNDSGPGSLRRAIITADVNGGGTINFAIGSGAKVIHSTPLPVLAASIVINATTQPGYSGQPLITIDSVDGSGTGVLIAPNGHGSTLRGLTITGFAVGVMIDRSGHNTIAQDTISGNGGNGLIITGAGSTGNTVAGNKIGTNAAGTVRDFNYGYGVVVSNGATRNTIGGTNAGAANVISGNAYSGVMLTDGGTANNVVAGNLIGTDASGTLTVFNGDSGITILNGASFNTIGGTTAGAANVISGNLYNGIDICGGGTSGNVVQGNFIGTNRQGSAAMPNQEGVNLCEGASRNTIGGTSAAARNVISGNLDNGVEIHDPGTTGNRVQGNLIGTDSSGGKAVPNLGDGVLVVHFASNNTIGGIVAGAGNTIAFNLGNGVAIGESPGETIQGVPVYNNSIFANAELGIDLADDGVTPNGSGASQPGPNKNQNFPVLTSVTSDGQTTVIKGTLTGAPSSVYRLEFYSAEAIPSHLDQGQTELGSVNVTTGSNGVATFTVVFNTGVTPLRHVTATATDGLGNTSEFSAGLALS